MNASDILAVIFLITIGIFILVGNIFVFTAVLRDNKLRNKSNVFILCLASADLMVAVFNIPLTIGSIFHPGWRGQDSGICQFSGFFEMLFLVASVQSLGIIGVNRFYYVVHWKTYNEKFTKVRVGLIILSLWALSVILCIPPFLGWGKYGYKKSKNHCFVVWRSDIAYTYFMVITCFLGPIFAMGICYYRIFKFNRERKKRKWSWLQRRASPAGSNEDVLNSDSNAQKKSIKLGKGKAFYKVEDGKLSPTPGMTKGTKSLPILKYVKKKSVSFKEDVMQVKPIPPEANGSSAAPPERAKSKSTEHSDHKKASPQDSTDSKIAITNTHDEGEDYDDVFEESKYVVTDGDGYNDISMKAVPPTIRVQQPSSSFFVQPQVTQYVVIDHEWTTDTDLSVSVDSNEVTNVTTDTDVTILDDASNNGASSETRTPKKTEKKASKKCCPTTRQKKGYSPQISKEERKLSCMLALMVIIFIIAWLPFVITMFLEFYTRIEIIPELDRMSLFIGYSNSLCNPVIYGLMNQRFRKVYKEILFLILRCGRVRS